MIRKQVARKPLHSILLASPNRAIRLIQRKQCESAMRMVDWVVDKLTESSSPAESETAGEGEFILRKRLGS